MRKTLATHLCCMLCLFGTISARADIVPDLYSAQVPVAGQSASAMARGSRAALADVLVKVSGSFDLLKDPGIKTALKDARSHVQQYAYSRGTPGGEGHSARFEFDSTFVSGLVREAGAPLWTANRPLVLAWVVIEDETGRRFLSRDAMPEQVAAALAEFSRRGVPVQIPLFDLTDAAAVSPEDAWRLDTMILQAASSRYKVEDIVVARLSTNSAAKVTGDWKYIHLDDQVRQPITAADIPSFFREGVSIVAQNMAARYAVAPSGTQEGGISMSVTGVFTYADYAGIVRWLESLELIDRANIVRVAEDRLELHLAAQASAGQLAAIIELNDRLLPTGEVQSPSQLSYRWQN